MILPLDPQEHHTVLAQLERSDIRVLNNEKISFGDYNIIGMASGLCGHSRLHSFGLKVQSRYQPRTRLVGLLPMALSFHLAGHTHGGQIQFLGRAVHSPRWGGGIHKAYFPDLTEAS